MSESVSHLTPAVVAPPERAEPPISAQQGESISPLERSNHRRRVGIIVAAIVIVALIVGLRFYRLESDPYPWLDWSAGLLTDEGFYIHNARNVAIFGHPRTDEFNNMLLSPLLHFAQVGVFRLLGAGSVQARLISVVASLLTLIIFFAAMRRGFGTKVAATATVFLGLDHTNLLFNRMALMDTPACLPAVIAFYAFVRAFHDDRQRTTFWLFACGAFVGLTIVSRSLCNYLLLAPLAALILSITDARGLKAKIKDSKRELKAVMAGLAAVVVVYLAVWYIPNRREISAMNRHYLTKQILPQSAWHLEQNLEHSVFGDTRGITPYLFRHAPAILLLAVLGIVFMKSEKGQQETSDDKIGWSVEGEADSEVESRSSPNLPIAGQGAPSPGQLVTLSPYRPITQSPNYPFITYLAAWLLSGWLLLSVISYSPHRYYVTTYPALAALAAISLWRLPEIWTAFWEDTRKSRIVRFITVWLLVYHGIQVLIHHGGVLSDFATWLELYVPATIIAWLSIKPKNQRHEHPTTNTSTEDPKTRTPERLNTRIPNPAWLIPSALALWLAVNGIWTGLWLESIDDSLIRTSKWLGRNLPPNSVLIGDPAPGVCMDNNFKAILVIKGLCNGTEPVEKFEGSPRYIVVVRDSPVKWLYWNKYYPKLLSPKRRIATTKALRWDVEFYAVDLNPERQARL